MAPCACVTRYVGSTSEAVDAAWVLDPSTGAMHQQQVTYNPALVKIFDEILVNAVDNGVREAAQSRIEVAIAPGGDGAAPTISILNDGPSIPVRKHAKEGVWAVEL